MKQARDGARSEAVIQDIAARVASLSPRERQVMDGLVAGMSNKVIAREFDPTKVLDFFEQSGITKLFMVPAAMQFVVRQPRAREVDFSRLKYMLYGASPIPAALLKECIDVFKCGFVQMYGMTETTGTIVALPPTSLDVLMSAGVQATTTW